MTNKTEYKGIPDSLTIEAARAWVEPRVSGKRLQHIVGVAEVARRIALGTGVDPFLAELSAWLHDACKEMKAKELVKAAEEFGMKLNSVERENGHLLHGPVGAQTARKELGLTNEEVLVAISEHTLGNVPMTDLSKVVFLADCLEEGRSADFRDPIWQSLDIDGKADLNKAMLTACNLCLNLLISGHKTIHPLTVECRNYFLQLVGGDKN